MDEKIKLERNEIQNLNINYRGQDIKVMQYISIENYEIILNDIMKNVILNSKVDNKIVTIKIRFAKCVMGLLTNIDINELTFNDIFTTDIEDILESNIINYSKCIENIIKEYDIYENQKGFGNITSKVPSGNEIQNIITEISTMVQNMDVTKLETILKGVAFNKAPLANFIAKATEKNEKKELGE